MSMGDLHDMHGALQRHRTNEMLSRQNELLEGIANETARKARLPKCPTCKSPLEDGSTRCPSCRTELVWIKLQNSTWISETPINDNLATLHADTIHRIQREFRNLTEELGNSIKRLVLAYQELSNYSSLDQDLAEAKQAQRALDARTPLNTVIITLVIAVLLWLGVGTGIICSGYGFYNTAYNQLEATRVLQDRLIPMFWWTGGLVAVGWAVYIASHLVERRTTHAVVRNLPEGSDSLSKISDLLDRSTIILETFDARRIKVLSLLRDHSTIKQAGANNQVSLAATVLPTECAESHLATGVKHFIPTRNNDWSKYRTWRPQLRQAIEHLKVFRPDIVVDISTVREANSDNAALSVGYFIKRSDQVKGPLTYEEVIQLKKAGRLHREDKIRKGKNGKWRTASELWSKKKG